MSYLDRAVRSPDKAEPSPMPEIFRQALAATMLHDRSPFPFVCAPYWIATGLEGLRTSVACRTCAVDSWLMAVVLQETVFSLRADIALLSCSLS